MTDDDGASVSDTLIVTVGNVSPFVDSGPDRIANEGDFLSLPAAYSIELADQEFAARASVRVAGSFLDPGALDSHTATIDWGDGTSESVPVVERPFGPQGLPTSTGVSGFVQGQHPYADDGNYPVTLRFTDEDGGVGTSSFVVTVLNVSPTVDAGPDMQAASGTPVNILPSFSDPGFMDTHTATIDWGDGTIEPGGTGARENSGATSGAVRGTHLYAGSGTFTILVTVTDDDGGVGSDSLNITLNETAENNPPTANDDEVTTDEDTPVIIDVLSDDRFAPDVNEFLSVTNVTQPAQGTAVINSDGTVSYTPSLDFFGSDQFTYTISDGQGGTASASVSVSIRGVNDAPSFTAGPSEIIQAGAGPQSVVAWAKNSSAGPLNEAGQSLQFLVTTDNPTLFAVPPTISADGTLRYTPAPSLRGIASLTAQLRDDGGTDNGGQDMSLARTFTITVLANGVGCKLPAATGERSFNGNVRARINKGALTLVGDASSNSISLGAGSSPGYFRVSGVGSTAVNGRAASVELGPVTQAIKVQLGGGDDNLVLDGTAGAMVMAGKLAVRDTAGDSASLDQDDGDERALSGNDSVAIIDALLERGLSVRLRAGTDMVSLCGSTTNGPVRVRTGRGSDTVLVNDSTMHDLTRVTTGRGPDVVAVETTGDPQAPPTVLHKCVRLRTRRGNDAITVGASTGPGNSVQNLGCAKIRGGRGHDSLDMGALSDPNANGNEFAQPPDVRGIEQQMS